MFLYVSAQVEKFVAPNTRPKSSRQVTFIIVSKKYNDKKMKEIHTRPDSSQKAYFI